MADLVPLGIRFESQEVDVAEKRLDSLAKTAVQTGQATEKLSNASRGTSSAITQMIANIEKAVTEMRDLQVGFVEGAAAAIHEAKALDQASAAAGRSSIAHANLEKTMRMGVGLYKEQNAHVLAYQAQMARVPAVHGQVIGSSKMVQAQMLNLTRQFTDVGVTAAMGMSPLMIMIQQGPQIAEALALMKKEGVGLSAALRQMLASAAPLIGPLVAIGAVVGAVFGAAALAARKLNQDNKDLVDGLGLTEKQMKRLKDEGVNTGVTIGDVFRGTFTYIRDAVAPMLAPVGKFFSDLFDWITKAAVSAVKAVVGGFVGAFEAIRATWKMLPAAIGDMAISAAQAVIDAVTKMVNGAIDRINAMRPLINAWLTLLNAPVRVGQIGQVSGMQLANPFAGAAQQAASVAADAFSKGFKEGAAGVDKVLGGIGDAILKAARDRITKAAGEADKAKKSGGRDPADPRDQTDEMMARVAAQVAAAKADELRAQLAVTSDIRQRADIERQILAAEIEQKQAQVDRQIADVADAKGLSDATKKELVFKLNGLQAQIAITGLIQQRAINEAEINALAKQQLQVKLDDLRDQQDLLNSQANLLRSSYARGRAELKIVDLKHQEERLQQQAMIVDLERNKADAKLVEAAKKRLATIDQIHANEVAQVEQSTRLVDAIEEATDAAAGFRNAFKSHNWARAFDELARTIETIKASFAANGLLGGVATAGSAIGSAIGGRTGRAVGNAAGLVGGGLFLGSQLAGYGASVAAANGFAALTGTAGVGALGTAAGGVATALGAAMPYIGAVLALVALAKAFQKPSNQGAGFDLITGQVSGDKRTAETEAAVKQTGEAILGMEQAFKDAGLTLTDTIRGLVIGSRDPSQIYTMGGKTLTSAVGDPAAAAEAALGAMLDGATYVSDTQKALVESMRAAGKGFDDITQALEGYRQAQAISGQIADQILQLTDPKAFDLKGVEDNIKAQRDAYKAAADAGYLTADQLTTINGQLDTLRGLQIDDVMKRYADAVNDAADAVSQAQSDLRDAYEAAAGPLRDTISKFKSLADSIGAYQDSLRGGALSPTQNLARLRRDLQNVGSLAGQGDAGALGKFVATADAYKEAALRAAPDQKAAAKELGWIRRLTDDAQKAAKEQVDVAQQQLDALTTQVSQFIELNKTAKDIVTAITSLRLANARQAGGAGPDAAQASVVALAAGGAVNYPGMTFDPGRYLASNKDLGKYAAANGLDPLAFAAQHWQTTGQYEVALELRKYARGGMHPGGLRLVGEEGPEIEATGPARYWSAPQTQSMLGGGDNRELIAEIRGLRAEVAAMRSDTSATSRNTRKTSDTLTRVTRDGDSLLTEAA